MGTPLQTVYDNFLMRIDSDEWDVTEDLEIAERDWRQLLQAAFPRFLFPRISLQTEFIPIYDEENPDEIIDEKEFFVNELTNAEIQVLAIIMKHEWVKRCLATWEEIKMLYSTKDFSQANHMEKLMRLVTQVGVEVREALFTYTRSINGVPFDYRKFAGKNNTS